MAFLFSTILDSGVKIYAGRGVVSGVYILRMSESSVVSDYVLLVPVRLSNC
jgi:hypothetical protein